MTVVDSDRKFVGVQISPISFIDEGVEPLLDTLQNRFGINVLLVGTISWLGLKVGRRISWELEGWPDHGKQEPSPLRGGSFIRHRPEFYRNTFIDGFRSTDEEFEGKDILEMIIPAAHERGMKVMPEVMEPLFNYAGHGSVNTVEIPNLPQVLEIDVYGRIGSEPCINHPDYRAWWHSIIEDYARNYDIDGIMWCNERRSPLDNLIFGRLPNCFCEHCRRIAAGQGINVEDARRALQRGYEWFQSVRNRGSMPEGAFVGFLRLLYENPEIMLWERFWVERNKDMDRELYGITKWVDSSVEFGLNVWNRNHLNPLRKAQWPWQEMTTWSDWVKPITYQHQSGGVYHNEMSQWHQSIFRDVSPEEMTPIMYQFLELEEAPWDEIVQEGFDPDTYVYGQCKATVDAVGGAVDVYMGLGIDAPRSRADQAVCTPDIAYRSVLATYRAGGRGVVFSPNYAGMNQTTLDGAARALEELGLKG
ncbi:hypothetical protein BH23CHL2_BH23CHL2_34200 [soil metagenome]